MLSKRLMTIRKKKKKTQQESADFLGISRPAYTAYESGTRSPDNDNLSKLADYFNTNVDYLLGRSEDDSPTGSQYEEKNKNDFHFYGTEGVQFIARSQKNLSPAAYQKMQELAKKAAELFDEEDDS